MILLNRIQEKNTKFLTTMVMIIILAMIVTYSLSSLLGSYFNTIDGVYMGVQLNLMITIIVIGVLTVVMLIMLPKQTVDDLFRDISNGHDHNYKERTTEQQIQDMIDEDLSSENNHNGA